MGREASSEQGKRQIFTTRVAPGGRPIEPMDGADNMGTITRQELRGFGGHASARFCSYPVTAISAENTEPFTVKTVSRDVTSVL